MSLAVLLVEDTPLNAELAGDLLELRGHRVLHCDSARALRNEVAHGAVADVVLMDILLPDGDGAELLGELRVVERFARTPIIALTAQAVAGELEKLHEAGFDAIMTKPIETRTFVDEIERAARKET